MNKAVDDYIYSVKDRINEIEQKKQEERLIELGLFERKYTDAKSVSAEYPHWDDESGRFYKEVAYKLSKEEYEEIIPYADQLDKLTKKPKHNIWPIVFWSIGIFYILITICVVLYRYDTYQTVNYKILFCGITPGILFIGIGEIVHKLVEISSK